MKLLRNLKESEAWLSLIDRIWRWAPQAITIVSAGWGSLKAGEATPWISAYGPIAIAACAFAGMAIAVLLYSFWTSARIRHERARFAQKLRESETASVNPLDSHFVGKRIKLDQFLPPYTEPVSGKTFVDCDLVGPVMLSFVDHVQFIQGRFSNCDLVALKKDGGLVYNALIFDHSTFRNCRFFNVTFLLPQGLAGQMPENSNWITDR